MYNALIIDTETTGLIRTHLATIQPYVCEFYGCYADLETNAAPYKELHLLIKPPVEMPADAFKSHHLSDDMLKDAPAFADVADQIKEFIENNFSFDQEMLDIQFEREGKSISWPAALCTVEQSIHLLGRRMKLSELYDHLFHEVFTDAHRAKNDVAALLRCCRELYKRGNL